MHRNNLVLLLCGLRTGHFGQGTFVQTLLPYFKNRTDISITLIKTDCSDIAKVINYKEDGVEILALPPLIKGNMLTGENNAAQKMYAQRIIGIIYPYLKDKDNLLFWVNSIDYLNVFYDLRQVFKGCKLMYVHHSFSWKYFINVPDHVFANEWKEGNDSFHSKAFEMTRYQQEIALISDIVVTVTNHAKDFFINVLNIDPNKIFTIYNGTSFPRKKGKINLRKKYGFTRNNKIIVFSGRITKDKGFPTLIKAFKLLADNNKGYRLVVLGSGRPLEYLPLVNPHWNKIIFTGELEHQQVIDFYQLADVGVIPSLHEQCSFTAIEMRLYKLPVLTSSVDGLDEVFSHNQDSLKLSTKIDKAGERTLDEKEMAGQLEKLVLDKKLSKQLVNDSYKKGVKMFTTEVMWNSYEKMLAGILN